MLLENLSHRGVKMDVVSAHPSERLDEDFQRLRIDMFFDRVEGSIHNKSRMIEEFAKDCERKVAYIGDTYQDMNAVKNTSCIGIAVTYGYQTRKQILEKSSPDHIVNTVGELTQFL